MQAGTRNWPSFLAANREFHLVMIHSAHNIKTNLSFRKIIKVKCQFFSCTSHVICLVETLKNNTYWIPWLPHWITQMQDISIITENSTGQC